MSIFDLFKRKSNSADTADNTNATQSLYDLISGSVGDA